MYPAITISREYGSGGREIGQLVASKLNIPFYDKKLITKIAESGGISIDILKQNDEVGGGYPPSLFYQKRNIISFYQQPLTTQIYLAQFNLIKELAAAGPCVIIGRCSDYALSGQSVSVFIYASLEARIARKLRLDREESPDEIRKRILTIDKQRKRYYEFHTDRKWGDSKNHQLCIHRSMIEPADSAELILQYIQFYRKGENHGSAERQY